MPLLAIGNRKRNRWFIRHGLQIAVAFAVYTVLLARPQIVFAYEAHAGNVALHARAPLPPRAAEIAAAVQQRVRASPFYDSADTYHPEKSARTE